MFRPVNRSSVLQQNKSKVLLKDWDPDFFFTVVNKYKICYWIKYDACIICWRPDDDLLTGRNMQPIAPMNICVDVY